eukprot:CAMPEP_0169390896 /NCGR_PEP_ID=MMETSP1017-20121227/47662_1 /TAXON_ID=342587 /ORGANISM="Karlodinium micrum, Strain CCMP2283" /LENGTH=728 /DNA_ID=CAMNT_0009493465 /DNA_START=203 /DNA_END=2386 /DNA_ORIENTATION=-
MPYAAELYGVWFKMAEAFRMREDSAEGRVCSSEYRSNLEESRHCLLECEKIALDVPSCTCSPESLYTCLAETHWKLNDCGAARKACQQALMILAHKDGEQSTYATLFVLWVFQNVAVEQQNWRDARSALKCAHQLFGRLEGSTRTCASRQHQRLLRKMERLDRKLPLYISKTTIGTRAQQDDSIPTCGGEKMTKETTEPILSLSTSVLREHRVEHERRADEKANNKFPEDRGPSGKDRLSVDAHEVKEAQPADTQDEQKKRLIIRNLLSDMLVVASEPECTIPERVSRKGDVHTKMEIDHDAFDEDASEISAFLATLATSKQGTQQKQLMLDANGSTVAKNCGSLEEDAPEIADFLAAYASSRKAGAQDLQTLEEKRTNLCREGSKCDTTLDTSDGRLALEDTSGRAIVELSPPFLPASTKQGEEMLPPRIAPREPSLASASTAPSLGLAQENQERLFPPHPPLGLACPAPQFAQEKQERLFPARPPLGLACPAPQRRDLRAHQIHGASLRSTSCPLRSEPNHLTPTPPVARRTSSGPSPRIQQLQLKASIPHGISPEAEEPECDPEPIVMKACSRKQLMPETSTFAQEPDCASVPNPMFYTSKEADPKAVVHKEAMHLATLIADIAASKLDALRVQQLQESSENFCRDNGPHGVGSCANTPSRGRLTGRSQSVRCRSASATPQDQLERGSLAWAFRSTRMKKEPPHLHFGVFHGRLGKTTVTDAVLT